MPHAGLEHLIPSGSSSVDTGAAGARALQSRLRWACPALCFFGKTRPIRHVQGLPKPHKRGRAEPSDVCECSSLKAGGDSTSRAGGEARWELPHLVCALALPEPLEKGK